MTGPTNIILNPGSGGAALGADTDGTSVYQIVKVGHSVAGVTPTEVSTTNPLPVSQRLDFTVGGQTLGHYRTGNFTNPLAPNANTAILGFRWTSSSALAVISRVYIGASVVTAVTAQAIAPVLLFRATGFTGSYSAGMLSMAPPSKMRTTMGNSLVGQIAMTNAAAGMTGATLALDANPIGVAPMYGLLGLDTGIVTQDLYKWDRETDYPLVLAQNEGFIVQWGNVTLASGTLDILLGVEWAELASF